MKRALVFGAGSIGRGFIGASLGHAGWHVTFVDVVPAVVERLNSSGFYNQVIVSNTGEETLRVEPVAGILATDTALVLEELHTVELVAVSVGAANLGPVADLLGQEATRRHHEGRVPLDVLLCENLHDAPEIVRAMIASTAGEEVAGTVGLAATSIGRMVPVPVPDPDDPLRVRVEPYSYLPYDASALHAQPDVPDLFPVTDGFAFYEDRKLYVHNMGHCMLAYLGELRGYEYVWQAVGDVGIRHLVRNAMVESASALATRYGQPLGPLLDHVGDLITRFGNRALGDTIERVGRDPERKMQPADRLLGSYRSCLENRIAPLHLSAAVALGTRRLAGEEGWDISRAIGFTEQHLFTDATPPRLVELFRSQLAALERGAGVEELITGIDDFHLPSRVV